MHNGHDMKADKFSGLRKKTQAYLSVSANEAVTMSREEIRRLVHELETHQTELELQNEGLRKTQQELEKSRSRLSSLYDFAPVGYLTLSDKDLVVEANVTAANMLGVEGRDLLKKPFSEFIIPEDRDVFYLNRRKLLETGVDRVSYEIRLRKKGGEIFPVLAESVADSGLHEQPGKYRLVLTDTSDLKALDEKLRYLKDRYRAIVMDQNDLICRFDAQGKITFVNDAYCRCFKVRHDEILGTNFIPNIYEEDLELVRNHFGSVNHLKPEKTIEHRVVLPGGEVRWQQWFGRAFFDDKDDIVEYQVVGRDITELKEAQKKLQDELRLRQIFIDALPCVALLQECNTRKIVAANKVAMSVGASPGKLCYETWLQRESPCPGCAAPELWSSGEPQHNQFWALGRFWDSYHIPVGVDMYLHYAFDSTESQKDRESLKDARDTLEMRVKERTLELEKTQEQLIHAEKLSALGSLSASIAHEFNNPLQGVMTIIKGIERDSMLEEKDKELVGLAFKECCRMRDLITSLQEFNRPSSGQLSPVDLPAVIDSLLIMSKKALSSSHITVQKQYGKNVPNIMGVGDKLKQVFLNLFNNAMHACKTGGTITIKTEVVDNNVIVHIQDTGSGIAPEHKGRIFEPFFTTKADLKGTGLGLSVSYDIIKKHGGTIEFTSEPGKGATFSVSLPIKGVSDAEEINTAG